MNNSGSAFLMDSQKSSPPTEFLSVDAHEAKDLVASGYRYLDVRMLEDFNKGHVDAENVFNIPYFIITPQGRVKHPEFLQQVLSVCNKEDSLLVGCATGGRSRLATVDLLNADFKHVRNMEGGYRSWHDAGYTVKKKS